MTETFHYTSIFPCRAGELYDYHARPGALQRLLPPWDRTEVVSKTGSLDPGGRVVLKLHLGPIPFTWEAHHVENNPGKMFRDIQTRGPFTLFSHTHAFSDTENGARLDDRIDFRLPGHAVLPRYAVEKVKTVLRRSFTYREHVLREDLLLHAKYSKKPLNILISGAGGVLGSALVPLLTTGGHKVYRLVRRKPDDSGLEIRWDPENNKIDVAKLPRLDGIIHLAGEYIGLSRWSSEKKRRVLHSRTRGTDLLARTIARLPARPKVFLSASAVGYYGDRGSQVLTEVEMPGNDYISEVCRQWEASAAPAADAGIRTVLMRLGVGLTPRGGALERLLNASPLAYIRYFGDGSQYISWISIDDMAAAILHCLVTTNLAGPVNITGPEPVDNHTLIRLLSEITGKPRVHPLPGRLLKTVFGQMASEILLSSCRVSSQKLLDSGFTYRHPDLPTALQIMLGRKREET